jgi:beta-glucanase (GH16 family)
MTGRVARWSLLALALGAFAGPATAHAAGVPVALVEAETMRLPAGASIYDSFDVFGGRAVKMPADGALRTAMTFARPADSVGIRVRSVGCRKGWPKVSITSDRTTLMSDTKVTDSGWTTQSAHGFALPVGTHTITIRARMTHGRGAESCNPVLYVDRSVFFGRKKALAVTPTGASPFANLVFGDEFAGTGGTQPDPARWQMKVGKPWNDQVNSYTARPANVAMDGKGALDLTALRETYTGADGVTRDYTSGGVLTKDTYTFTYGHVEARIWAPAGRGFWSAFWSLRFPIGAEIDILEHNGASPKGFHTNIRSLKTDGRQYWSSATYSAPSSLATAYHVYGMTWEPGRISWQLDGTEVRSVTPANLPSDYRWNYTQPEWLILNLGVGGDWVLEPNSTTPFPSRMKVDWVRVFQ